MITITQTKSVEDIAKIQIIMQKYFKPHEIVSNNEFIYYIENYNKLYEGEDYFVYKIEDKNEIIGMLSGVKLNEFIVVDYFIVDAAHRCSSKYIMNTMINILKSYKLPIVIEAETESLCRLYQMFGFKKFSNPYKYIMLDVSMEENTSKILEYDSNLLFLSPCNLDFETTKQTIYKKHYMRWYSIYNDKLTKEYKKKLCV